MSEQLLHPVAAAAPRNVVGYIDSVGGSWITGTGKVGATAGDGNGDLLIANDGVHPSPAGHDYYARRIGQTILDTLATL